MKFLLLMQCMPVNIRDTYTFRMTMLMLWLKLWLLQMLPTLKIVKMARLLLLYHVHLHLMCTACAGK